MARRVFPAALVAAIAGLIVFVTLGAASVNVAQSGWSWGNPTPQGNTLRAIDFVQGRGYAAGDAGTVLRTDDGGATWTGLATGTSRDLGRLQVVDPQTLVVLGGDGCALRRSDDAGATFHRMFTVTEQACPNPLTAFTFVDRNIGYLLQTDGSVLRTTDGGQTFSRQTAVPGTQASNNGTGATAVDIAFTGPDSGVVFVSPPSGAPSVAYATTDDGVSWKPVGAIDPGHVRRVWFLDAKNGYAIGADTLLKSDDGGATWKAQPAGPGHDLTSIRCSDVNTCLMTTTKGDVLLRTTDGGQTVTPITASSQAIHAAAFESATRVVAVGESGSTVVSDDGGVNYTPISRDIGGTYQFLRPGPVPSSAFALGPRGALAGTTDAGASWKTLAVPTSTDVVDVAFPDASTGYALDLSGGLFKTTNGGATWQTLDTGQTSAPRALAAPAPDTIVLVGPRGIRRGTGSAQPQAVGGAGIAKAALSALVARGNLLVAYGPATRNAFMSRDGGKSWARVKLPGKKTKIGGALDFVNRNTGFLVDFKGLFWKTTNGGRKWTQLFGAAATPSMIAMTGPTTGFAGLFAFPSELGTATVLRTSDGGKTWRPQAIARGPLGSVLATGPNQGYALVGTEHLFFTGSGGDAGTPTTLRLRTPVKVFTAKALKKAKGRVTVNGTLPGAVGGEQIVVSRRDVAGGRWISQVVTAGANGGSFTSSWRIKRSSVFVAQWAGDSGRRGAGSLPLFVNVNKARR
jgi:photosystem II stability/assembly factor-like uncharacterized protein